MVLNTHSDSSKSNFVKLSEAADKVMQKKFSLKKTDKAPAVECGGSAAATVTGLKSLDDLLKSFMDGQLYVIGGRPGMGKTALLTQIAVHIAASTGKSVYIQSLETSAEQIVLRMISQIVDIDQRTILYRNLSKEQKDLMYLCWSIMDAMPVYICDTAKSMNEISSLADKEVKDGILLIDCLQLIRTDIQSKTDIKRDSNTFCNTYSLKCLARQKKIPIVVCSLVSRAPEIRSDKRPILNDLREEVSLEDPDGVIFIYRDSYYNIDGCDDAELILAKNRNGEIGTAYVKFNRYSLSFQNK